jgi:hypothetical protein
MRDVGLAFDADDETVFAIEAATIGKAALLAVPDSDGPPAMEFRRGRKGFGLKGS